MSFEAMENPGKRESAARPEFEGPLDEAATKAIELVEKELGLTEENPGIAGETYRKVFEVDTVNVMELSGSLPVNPQIVAAELTYEPSSDPGDSGIYRVVLVHEGGDYVYSDESLRRGDPDLEDTAARSDIFMFHSGVTGGIAAETKPHGVDSTLGARDLKGEQGAAIIDRFRESAEMIIALAQQPQE